MFKVLLKTFTVSYVEQIRAFNHSSLSKRGDVIRVEPVWSQIRLVEACWLWRSEAGPFVSVTTRHVLDCPGWSSRVGITGID